MNNFKIDCIELFDLNPKVIFNYLLHFVLSGQDEYSIFPTQYSVDIDGYVLVYSIDSEQSFDVVQVSHLSV